MEKYRFTKNKNTGVWELISESVEERLSGINMQQSVISNGTDNISKVDSAQMSGFRRLTEKITTEDLPDCPEDAIKYVLAARARVTEFKRARTNPDDEEEN